MAGSAATTAAGARLRPKVLLISTHLHRKNLHALGNYNIDFDVIDDPRIIQRINFNDYEYVYSPAMLIYHPENYPNTKFMFGPHVSVFPKPYISSTLENAKNVVYVQPSEWARKAWADTGICKFPIEVLPFGVDVDKFSPSDTPTEEDDIYVFIYYKRRSPIEFQSILKEMNQWVSSDENGPHIEFRVFDYVEGYKEEEYLEYLKKATFGIWIGSHESQGFALEEALSCNVPLLVWDAINMNQEYDNTTRTYNHPSVSSTTAPYWDERCGEKFTMYYEFRPTFSRFLKNLSNYNPRQYILENLTYEKCEARFLEVLNGVGTWVAPIPAAKKIA